MIRKILNSFVIAKKIEAQMNMLSKNFKKKDTHKVRITEEQIKILGSCAMAGIFTLEQFKRELFKKKI